MPLSRSQSATIFVLSVLLVVGLWFPHSVARGESCGDPVSLGFRQELVAPRDEAWTWSGAGCEWQWHWRAYRFDLQVAARVMVELDVPTRHVPYVSVTGPEWDIVVGNYDAYPYSSGQFRRERTIEAQLGAGEFRILVWTTQPVGDYSIRLARTVLLTTAARPVNGSGGYVDVQGGTKVKDGAVRFIAGETATVIAHSNAGWRFTGWFGDASGTSTSLYITMDHDMAVGATWEEETVAHSEVPFGGEVHEPCPNPDPQNRWHGGDLLPPGGYSPLDTEKVHDAKKLVTRVLFRIPGNQDVVHCTNADYNDFGEPGPEYNKGHAGWDVQTTSVAHGATANVPFYSLTDGEVVYVDSVADPDLERKRQGRRPLGAIGVYDDTEDFTVYYLHARYVYVREDQRVSVGDRLGIQGDVGSTGKEHVHIEVHRGRDHNGRKHPFTGAVNAPNRGGSDTLLLWHEQLNYLCAASTDSPLRRDDEQCSPLDEIHAPSPDLWR